MKAKTVEYNNVKYTITFEAYGYGDSRFCVNGEATSFYMSNKNLNDVDAFKSQCKRAIEEYIAKKEAQKNFDAWDGKL